MAIVCGTGAAIIITRVEYIDELRKLEQQGRLANLLTRISGVRSYLERLDLAWSFGQGHYT